MGDFHYDDQSTFNSSIVSNYEFNNDVPYPALLKQQYDELHVDDQLKNVHDEQAQEIIGLTSKLNNVKQTFSKQEECLKNNIMLLEKENEQKSLSLNEAQALLGKQ